jgi:two-component system, OmpR family, sensor histidine kinase BaeS
MQFLSHWHLRTKLVLSHLLAALGSLILLTVVVIFVIQNIFNQSQDNLFHARATYAAQQFETLYTEIGYSWNNIPPQAQVSVALQLIIINNTEDQTKLVQAPPNLYYITKSENTSINQCLDQAANGSVTSGYIQGTPGDASVFSGSYICQPLTIGNSVIGSMFFAEPENYPQGVSVNGFVGEISQTVLLISAGIAIVVILCSLLFAQKLAKPLVLLQKSVDRVSAGDYTERVMLPERRDEVGQLINSFNNMAARIEANIHEIKQQEQIRRELTANMAHDLATPLATIQGFSEALSDGVIQDELARNDTYQIIVNEVQRLRRLVQKVQHLTSLEAGGIHLELMPLDISDLVAETLEMIGSDYEKADITLHNEMQQPGSMVLADNDSIIQILLNLLDNAKRYTPEGGSITIGSSADDEMTSIWVSDTGSGIDSDNLPRIFDRFYRADPSRTQATGGSGLGLSIVRALIELHGGSIWAESTPGSGTKITFTLQNAPVSEIIVSEMPEDNTADVTTSTL